MQALFRQSVSCFFVFFTMDIIIIIKKKFIFQDEENLIFERKNLINVCKLVIKDLIDTSLLSDRCSLESESNELKHFFIVLENIFNHGFKGKK